MAARAVTNSASFSTADDAGSAALAAVIQLFAFEAGIFTGLTNQGEHGNGDLNCNEDE